MGVATTPEFQADELAAWAAHAPLTEGILTPFGVIDAARLSQNGCIDALVGLERLKAWVEAQQVRIMAEADAHPDPVPPTTRHLSPQDVFEREQWAHESLTQEIACALRWAPGTAKSRIHVATVLVQRLSATLDTMETGTVSYLHARSLVETIRDLDPRGEADKHEACAADRRVGYQPDEHAMAWLNAYLPAVDAETIMIVIQAVADLMHADDQRRVRSGELCEPRTADQLRADALTAICAAVLTGQPITGLGDGGVDEATLEMLHNLPRWQGRRPNVNRRPRTPHRPRRDEVPAAAGSDRLPRRP